MYRSSGFVAMLAAAVAFPAFAANAPTVEKPTPKVGDVVEYAKRVFGLDCQRWEVTAVNEGGYNIRKCGDYQEYVDAGSGGLAKVVSGDKKLFEYKPYFPAVVFPIELGKKWEGKYDGYRADQGASWSSNISCEAKAFESVKVPAGEFDAYRITCVDNWQAPPFAGESDSTSWYVPKIGVVKYVNVQDSSFDYELAAYHVK